MSDSMATAPLCELATIRMGQSPDSATVNEDERGLPFLQGCAEFGPRFPTARLHCFPPLRIAREGSTLISVRAPVGTMNRADQDYCIGRGLGAVMAKPGQADNVFLLNAINQNLSYLHRRSQGSTFLAIGSNDLLSMPVAAPDLPLQQRIAKILSTVDETIEQTETLIAKTQQIKAGLMHDLFTQGVTKDGRLRPPRDEAPQLYKESPLGWIPREWEVDFVTSFGEVVTGRTPPAGAPQAWGTIMPFVTPAEVLGNGSVAATERDLSSYGLQFVRVLPARSVLVVCIGSTIGKVGLASWQCATNQQINAIICYQDTNPIYANAAITKNIFQIHLWAGLQAVPIVNKSQFERMLVPIAPFDEQIIIADRIESVDAVIKQEETAQAKLAQIKRGLMHDLLTERVRVTAFLDQREAVPA